MLLLHLVFVLQLFLYPLYMLLLLACLPPPVRKDQPEWIRAQVAIAFGYLYLQHVVARNAIGYSGVVTALD